MRFENQRSEQLSSSCCVVEVLPALHRPPLVGGPQVCKSAALQNGGCTRVNHSDIGLYGFMNSRVENHVGLEFLLGVLVGQTRVLSRRHTVQASKADKATLQHVVPCKLLRAADGVFEGEWGIVRTVAALRHVRNPLSSSVRH